MKHYLRGRLRLLLRAVCFLSAVLPGAGCDGVHFGSSEPRRMWETGGPPLVNPTDVAIHPTRGWVLVADPGLPGIVVLDIETGGVHSVHRAGGPGGPWLAPERIGYSRALDVVAVFDAVAQTVYLLDGGLEPLSKVELPRVMLAVKDVLALDSTSAIVAGGAVSDSIPLLGIWRFESTTLTEMARLSSQDSSQLSAALLAKQVLAGGSLAETNDGLFLATALHGDVWLLERPAPRQVATGPQAPVTLDDIVHGGSDGQRGIWWSMPTALDLIPAAGKSFFELHSSPDSGWVRLYQLRPATPPVLTYEWRDRVRAAAALSIGRYVVIREAPDGSRAVALLHLPGIRPDSTRDT